MLTKRTVGLCCAALSLSLAVTACSSDSDDPSSPSDDPASTTVAPVADSTVAPVADSTPSTGLGSIDGPATVDPDFGGANPGEGGG